MTTLIGTNPDQIPINSMLGGMAYQDPESINVKDFNSSGTANIASLVSPAANINNLSYSGTLTGGTGVINIGSNQIYKDASGNVGLGAVPISNGKTLTLVNTTTNASSFYLQNSTTGFTTTDGTLLQLDGLSTYLWNFENSTLSLATNNTEYVKLTSTGDLLNLGTGATKLQEGTTAQRPASPQEGMIRKNSTLGVIEGYSGGGYVSLEAGRLIKVTEYTASPGTDQSFTLDPKTQYILVEMIGGGGSGGAIPGGTYTSGHASVAGYGAVGSYCSFYIPSNILQRTYYYRIGAGGPSAGSTILAETLGALTSGSGRIECGAGANGHAGAAAALPPVAPATTAYEGRLIPRSGNFSSVKLIKNGGLSSNVGYKSLILGGVQSLIVLSPDDITNGVARLQPADLTFGYWGAGGRGEFKLQGVYSDVAYNGIQGMIRIYEYS